MRKRHCLSVLQRALRLLNVGGALVAFFLLALIFALAQSDRGSITGTVADPQGAAIADAAVQAIHADTGQRYQTKTTETGNYTLPQLPAGQYSVEVENAGFKKFVQQGVTVQVSQIGRLDVSLQVGSVTDSVTVAADVSLLKTDTTEVSHNLTTDAITALPIVNAGFRSPYTFLDLMPGASVNQPKNVPGNSVRVNGLPNNSGQIRIDGLEAGNSQATFNTQMTQPSVDSLQEVSVQASNFAAEYGQAAGGVINFTSRSGTNEFHARLYDYFTNYKLNAGQPYTNDGNGNLVRPKDRGNDWGFTVGGPVSLPKIYDGHNKTFFFFAWEQLPQNNGNTIPRQTTPTAAMRGGDFSGILGPQISTDILGRPIRQNQIFDPLTETTINGQPVRDPFPNNVIPISRLSPVALRIQDLLPLPLRPGNVANYDTNWIATQTRTIPSIKVDQALTGASKLSFYYSYAKSESANNSGFAGGDGFPDPITMGRDIRSYAHTTRLSYDNALTPTLLFHFSVGYQTLLFADGVARSYVDAAGKPRAGDSFDSLAEIGLKGTIATGFPRINGLSSSFGGAPTLGSAAHNNYIMQKPSGAASLSYVRGNHTFKAGAEWRIDANSNRARRGQGVFNFSPAQTAQTYLQATNIGGSTLGFSYASFLLGDANSATLFSNVDSQYRKTSWGFFIQDNWKVTRKLTLDYGLRWDLLQPMHEIHNRLMTFDPTVPNPSAGGRLGAVSYDGYGTGRCNCRLMDTYPYAVGPRLGFAYNLLSKTVLRGGWGISYGPTPSFQLFDNAGYQGVGFNTLAFTSPAFAQPAANLTTGLQYNPADLYAATLDPGVRPDPGQTNSPSWWVDRSGGRPSRINEWNITLQQELSRNLAVEAAYVGNRGVWQTASSSILDLNGNTAGRLAAFGLNLNNAADRSLLLQRMTAPQVAARGFGLPYAGFPVTATLAQALRPFPQYSNIPVNWAPLGSSWYDALQVKATQRASHGLSSMVSFTWSKNLNYGENTAINDSFNRPLSKSFAFASQPRVLTAGVNYDSPRVGPNGWIKALTGDWTLGAVVRYASGLPIRVPSSNNNLNALLLRQANPATFANRVPAQPLFLADLNCHCFDPNKTLVLNPAAWSDPVAGQFGTAAPYYDDYRNRRRPAESFSIGRGFKFRERLTLQVRAQFTNFFNRAQPADPTATNFAQPPTITAAGQYGGGFGWINTGSLAVPPRTGQIYARLMW